MTITPIAAIKEYFGYLPGETPAQFLKEVKELTLEDRKELAEGAAKALGKELVAA